MTDIDGNALSMASDFGTIGFGTLEPGNGSNEEQICFTGLVNNSNGTVTLTGISNVTFVYPYTQSSGLAKTHAGSTSFIISNTSGYYDQFPAKNDDSTVNGDWTFTGNVTFSNFPVTPSNSDASTTVKGVTKLSSAPVLASNPIAVGDTDSRIPIAYAVDAAGSDAYAITPSPAIAAYAAGQTFTFKAGTANIGAATLNVSALGAKSIKKNVSVDLVTGDILANQIVTVVYDGTNMQFVSGIANAINSIPALACTSDVSVGPASSITQTITHGLGRLPVAIRLSGMGFMGTSSNASTTPFSIGTFTSSGNKCVYIVNGASGGATSSSAYSIYLENAATLGLSTGVVGNLNSTTFDIVWTNGGATGASNTFMWEAQ